MSLIFALIASFLFALSVSLIANFFLLRSRISTLIVDRPNHRSLHGTTIPRTGGLGIALALLLSFGIQHFLIGETWEMIARTMMAYLVLLAVSIIDDIRPVPAKVRLVVHFVVVTLWLISQYKGSWQMAIIMLLGITWAMNLYNFMDGSDGLAGNVTLISFLAYSAAACMTDDPPIALLCMAVSGATLGFLRSNWPPAKLFLGDAGSVPIGFLAAAVGTMGVLKGLWDSSFPLMLFAMFWIDATYTLARRAFRGEKVWQAHNEHWYQKAIRAGNSHRKILLIHLVCNSVIAGLALLSTLSPTFATPLVHILTIGTVLAIAFGFGVWAESQFRSFQAKQIN